MLLAAAFAKRRYPFQVADNAGTVVDIRAATGGAVWQRAFINGIAVITNGNFDINTEVVAWSFLG